MARIRGRRASACSSPPQCLHRRVIVLPDVSLSIANTVVQLFRELQRESPMRLDPTGISANRRDRGQWMLRARHSPCWGTNRTRGNRFAFHRQSGTPHTTSATQRLEPGWRCLAVERVDQDSTRKWALPSSTIARPRSPPADLLNDQVLPFFSEQGIVLSRVLTDRGTDYCGNPERHEYELYLAVENIDHTRTKTKSPQTNGIVERFHKTMLDELYQVAFRKKTYGSIKELQQDLDAWLANFNEQRPHQGRWCYGKTPMQTFLDSLPTAKEKLITALTSYRPMQRNSDSDCQVKS